MLREDKLPSLLLSDKLINQRDDWQPLNHSSGIGSGSASPNYGRVSHKPLTLLLVSSSVEGFQFSFTEQKKKHVGSVDSLTLFALPTICHQKKALLVSWQNSAPSLFAKLFGRFILCALQC